MADADTLKAQGNAAFQAKDYDKAIDLFTQAIQQQPDSHVLYSNRSGAYAGKRDWAKALEDADETIKHNPTWAKGYGRKGAALHGARRLEEAAQAYEEGLKLESSNAQLQRGLNDVRNAMESEGPAGSIGKLFSDPNLLSKLASNPKTAPLLADPSFVQKLKDVQANPQNAQMAFQDPRMIQVMGVAMGIDLEAFERPAGSEELPPHLRRDDAPKPTSPPPSEPTPSSSKPTPPPSKEDKLQTDEPAEEDPNAEMEKKAEEEKKIANGLYMKRQFDEAIQHYEKAWELHKDITYLTNMAACYFEKGDYDKSIELCEKAVEEGREQRADFKLIAKALGRIGSSYLKKDDLDNAIKYFQKSLTEHRTPDILHKLREAEKAKAEKEKQAYINPELAEKAREEGNAQFKAGDFAASVKSYSEAIKRNPSDPRGYTNRAAAYNKLVALPEALKDAEKAIEVDPKFVKGYIRKAHVLNGMRDFTKALEAAQKASDYDTDGKNAREIEGIINKAMQTLYAERANETDQQTLERAMRDPEVASIMQDPIMNNILQQAQENPASLQDHMKNPMIREKIQKLIRAGIIKTRMG